MSLLDALRPGAGPALRAPDGAALSFDDLKARALRLAAAVSRRGLRPGDRALVLLPLGPALYTTLLALFHIGVTVVLVDPRGPLRHALARTRPVAFFGSPRAQWLRLAQPALRGLRLTVSDGFSLLPAARLDALVGPDPADSAALPPAPADGPVLITFTTGSTGTPRALARTPAQLLAQHAALRPCMDLRPTDTDLPTLPVFSLHALACGAGLVLPDADLRRPGAVDGARLAAQIAREGVTTAAGSPALFLRVAAAVRAAGPPLRGVRALWLGGARVSPQAIDAIADAFPAAELHIVYGSSEAEPIAHLDARAHRAALHATAAAGEGALVGAPVPGVRVGFDGDEILVGGDHVLPGYWEDPAATDRRRVGPPDAPPLYRTGDAGFARPDGALVLRGRAGGTLGGRWPLAVEGAAECVPGVAQAALALGPDGPLLAFRAAPDAPPAARLADALRERTGLPARPLAQIPTDPRHNAKIDRPALQRALGLPPLPAPG